MKKSSKETALVVVEASAVRPVTGTTLDLGVHGDAHRQRIVVSSRDVARIFEKRHDNVMRDINGILSDDDDFNRLNFEGVEYRDAKGEYRPEFLMTKDGFTLLVMGYTGEKAMRFKKAYIAEFNRLQERQARFGGFVIPDNYADALTFAGEQVKEVQRLTAENAVLQPKADFYDVAMSTDDFVNMNTVAKILNYKNMGQNNLYKFLRENGVLQQDNRPYQQHMDKGYFKVVTRVFSTVEGNVTKYQTFVSQRGIDAIRRLLNKHGKGPNRPMAAIRKAA